MTPEVAKILAAADETEELKDFRTRLMDLVRMSRSTMKNYYDLWDRNDSVYRGERKVDEQDKKALKRNEPSKVYVPLTHTQVQTFVSFATMLITGRDFVFELGGRGIEDERPAKMGQALLQRDLEYNKFDGVLLPQFLTDVARYGVGVFKTQWRRLTCPYQQQVPDPTFQPIPGMPMGAQAPMVTQWTEKTKYLGNIVEVISPYRWFPDTRLPLTRYRDGEFCADENEYSMARLTQMEKNGEVAGLQYVPRLPDDVFSDRRFSAITQETNSRWDPTINPRDASHFTLITEVELRCNPSQTLIAPKVPLGDIDADVVVLVWIANDGRIIRIDDSGYDHNEFLHDAAQFFNDQNRLINFGIAELLGPMQDIMDWLLNVRVSNVRKVVQNMLIVDPKNIEMQDLKDRLNVIRLKSTVPEGLAIDNYIKQLQVTDVTANHLTDMAMIKDFSGEATGLQENLMGQYTEGRRSAREVSNVNANGAGRVITPIKGLWQGAILPVGRKMLSNHRQGLDEDQLVRVIGIQRFLENRDAVAAFMPVNKELLMGDYDFLVFEGTLPSQRMAIAAAVAQAGEVLIKSPMSVFALQLDPKLLFEEWLELQGVRNAERFRLTPQRAGELVALAQLARNGGGAQPPPGQGGNGGPPNQG